MGTQKKLPPDRKERFMWVNPFAHRVDPADAPALKQRLELERLERVAKLNAMAFKEAASK